MFLKLTFFKKFIQVFIRVSNSLNPDQEWRSVGPETGQKLFANTVINRQQKFEVSAFL